MKKLIRAIFLSIATISNHNMCMEKSALDYDIHLNDTEKFGINLVQLLIIETNGNFSQKMLVAEKLSFKIFQETSKKERQQAWTKETIELAELVSQRPRDRNQIFSIIKNEDNADELEKIINRNPSMPNAYNAEKITLLHQLVILERRQCIKKLLSLYANPNSLDGDACSPLHRAIEKDVHVSIVRDLLAAGALASRINLAGKTPFKMACEKNSPAVEAFEKHGYLFFSALWPYKNPLELLKNNGRYLAKLNKEPIGSPRRELALIALKKLFNHLSNGESPYQGIITNNRHGFALCHVRKEQCENYFGKDLLVYAQNLIEDWDLTKHSLPSANKENNNDMPQQ